VLAPVASDIGHGQLGARGGLRTLDTLARQSRFQKHAGTEIRGSKLVASWAGPSSSIYSATVDEEHDGRPLDVVSVVAGGGALARVESQALVVAGTFYFDQSARVVYARTSFSTAPGATDSFAVFGWYFGSCRMVHPTLGTEKIVNGGFETTIGTDWATTSSGAADDFVVRDTAVFGKGAASARIQATVIPGGYCRLDNDAKVTPTITGQRYRLSLMYRTDPTNPTQVRAAMGAMYDTGTDQHILDDGRSTTSTQTPILLASTGGEWQRAVFDFIAPGTNICARLYLTASGGTGYGKVWFDDVSIKPIWTYEEYSPRLSFEALPPVSAGRRGIFFERPEIGAGTLSINNGDGYLESLFGLYEFTNATVFTRVGGRFPNGGNETLLEDMLAWRWTAQRADVQDGAASLQLDGPPSVYLETLPNRFADEDTFTDVSDSDAGRPRPLIFGTVTNLKPSLIDNTDHGLYELADGALGVDGIKGTFPYSNVHAYAYLDTQAADQQDAARRVELPNTTDYTTYTVDTALGQIEITTYGLPIEITPENNLIDFSVASSAITSSSVASPTVITATGHGFATGDVVVISGHSGSVPDINGQHTITVTGANTFTVGEHVTTGGTGGVAVSKASALVATVAPGIYEFGLGQSGTSSQERGLANAICTAMDTAAGVSDHGLSYSTSTKKVTLTKGAGKLNLLVGTGVNKSNAIWKVLGFNTKDDKTGALSYQGDNAVFVSPEKGIIRASCDGFKDDSSGTYTGTANAVIQKAGDILYFLLRQVLGIPVDQIDTDSVATVRTGADNLAAVIGCTEGPLEFGEIAKRFEQSSRIELLHDGTRFFFRLRDNTVPTDILEVGDREILPGFRGWFDQADLTATVTIEYGQDPSTGRFRSATGLTAAALARLPRAKGMTVRTYLPPGLPAATVHWHVNTSTPRRRFRFRVKGAAIRKSHGDKIRITRSAFLGRTAAAPSVVCRILNISHNLQTWESDIEVAEVLSITNGW
jgi:hypothetical protein